MKRANTLLFLALGITLSLVSCKKEDNNTDCQTQTWYQDADGDGLGNPAVTQEACDQPTGYVSNSNDLDDTDNGSGSTTYEINSSYFNSSSLVSFDTVTCTLENGSTTICYQLKFTSNPLPDGPYCPATINDIGGLGVYDGATNPGFQVMKAALFNAMENDGYDIVDSNGDIRIDDFNSGMPNPSYAYCLDAAPNDNLQLTFLIPKYPELLSSDNVIETVELIGVSTDGVPINGDPPSVVNGPGGGGMGPGGGNIPAIDPCGGHNDPAGYYHLHFIPQAMNAVLSANSITEVSCTNIAQSTTALIGFAKDGYPIYSSEDASGLPTDLDNCNGHFGATAEFPNGIYHYHASATDAPNVPPCLKGAAASTPFSYQ